MPNQENPYVPPVTEPSPKQPLSKAIFAHCVAAFGAALVFVGAFLGIVGLPSMFSEAIASSVNWMIVLLVLGVILGAVAAVMSYRATLRTYAKPS